MKLEIESVEFKNFLSFGSKVQRIPFLKGLNLVTGNDVDRKRSNGSGKSSFLESVPFALFGQVHRNINKKQIVNWKNRKNCEVSLDFTIGKDNYKVLRAIKPDNFEIYKNTVLIDKPSHVKEYQATLEEIIGLNFQTFMSLIHSNINSSAKILTMSKPEKRKLIDMMFGLTIYKLIQEKSNQKLRGIEEKLRVIEINNNSTEERIKDLSKDINELEFKASKKPYQFTQLKEKEEELKDLKVDYEDIKEELEEKRNELNIKESDSKYIESLLDKMNTSTYKVRFKLKNIEERIEKWKKNEKIILDNEYYEQKLREEEDVYGNIEVVEKLLSETIEKILDIEKKSSSIENECNSIERELTRLKRDREDSVVKLDKLEKNICPTCNQKISDTSLILNEKRKLESTELKEKEVYGKKDDLTSQYNILEKDLPSLKRNKKEIEITKNNIVSLKNKIVNVQFSDNREDLEKDKKRYEGTIKKLESLFGKFEPRWKELKKNISILTERVDDLREKISKITIVESEISRLKEFIEIEQKNQKEFISLIDKNKKRIESLSNSISESIEKKENLMSLKDYISSIKDVCKDENIKQHAISSIIPYINEKANYYLSEVNYSFYVVLDKWLEMQVKGPGITEASYGSLSGGESRGIDIAIQLAFLDISKLRAPIFPDFLTFDELLDSSIDSGGISQLFKIISVKQKKDDSKTFIISHRSELDEMSDVDNIYHVTKKGGYSTVEII